MASRLKKFLLFLSVLDLFQQNISLKLYNRSRISITLGKFFSLTIYAFLLYNFFASDMITKNNPIVLQNSIQSLKRPTLIFNHENFILAFAVVDSFNIIQYDPTIFRFRAVEMQAKNGANVTIDFKNIGRCEESYFDRFPNYYKNLNLTWASCIKNDNFTLSGYWDESESSQLNIGLEKCENSTDSNIICKSNQEIEEFFLEKYFSFWMEDNNFDLTNYDRPISSRIKNMFRTIESKKAKIMKVHMKKTTLLLDKGLIYNEINQINTYSHGDIDVDTVSSETKIFGLFLYSSEIRDVFQRRYQKLFDVLAGLGGVLNVLLIFGSVLVKFFYEWKMNELIMNKFYIFAGSFTNFSSIKSRLSKISKIAKFIKLRRKQSDFSENIIKCPTPNENKKLILSLYEGFILCLKRKRKRNQKERMYLEYLKKSNQKLDLIEIMRKLDEIEKIKLILFDDRQLDVFNSLAKRYISFSKMDKTQRVFKYKLNLARMEKKQRESIEKYVKVLREKDKNELEDKLLSLIGKEVEI